MVISAFIFDDAIRMFSVTLFAATGTVTSGCGSFTLSLSKVDGLPAGQKLFIREQAPYDLWWQEHAQNAWETFTADRRFADGKYETTKTAKIWINNSATQKYLSGKYDVNFDDLHLQGEFFVKYRKRRKLPVCE